MILPNNIYNMDCLEGMKLIKDKSIDLVLTDPPYNFNPIGGGLFKLRGNLINIKETFGTNFKPEPYLAEFKRILRVFNAYIFCSKDLVETYLKFARENGFGFNILVWHKTNPIPCNHNNFLPDTEYIIYIRESGATFNNGLAFKTYKKYSITPVEKLENHPTPKPIDILRKFIKISSNAGDLILDPFLGSGTTAVACKQLNRNFIGFDINKDFCDLAKSRLYQENLTNFLEVV